MIEMEGNISNQLGAISIDLRVSHSYIDPRMEHRFNIQSNKLERSWLI